MSIRPPFRRLSDSTKSESSSLRPSFPPRVNVILHRTGDLSLLFIVRVVRELTRFGEAEAMSRMWEAHHRGRALVLVTHFERAELYVEQFADRGLRASLEPA